MIHLKNTQKNYQVRVPGKIMLAGEYSVLNGETCLSVGTHHQMSIVAKPNDAVALKSNFKNLEITCYRRQLKNNAAQFPEFKIFLETVYFAINHFKLSGVDLEIQSELSPEFGFGSSSALRLGVLSACGALARNSTATDRDTAHLAYDLQKKHQKQASGYDVFTQFLGGGLLYQSEKNFEPVQIARTCEELSLYTLGDQNSVPTGDLIHQTTKELSAQNKFNLLHRKNKDLIDCFLKLLTCKKTSPSVYQDSVEAMSQQRKVFQQCSYYPEVAIELEASSGCDREWSFKTTGAGGSDALIVFSDCSNHIVHKVLQEKGWDKQPLRISQKGVQIFELAHEEIAE